jgi:hypothetical protein
VKRALPSTTGAASAEEAATSEATAANSAKRVPPTKRRRSLIRALVGHAWAVAAQFEDDYVVGLG